MGRRRTMLIVLVAGMVAGSLLVTPAGAQIGVTTGHLSSHDLQQLSAPHSSAKAPGSVSPLPGGGGGRG